jgi:hypothetical protein
MQVWKGASGFGGRTAMRGGMWRTSTVGTVGCSGPDSAGRRTVTERCRKEATEDRCPEGGGATVMNAAEHTRRLAALTDRIDAAAERIFEGAERLSSDVQDAETRVVDQSGDAPRVGPRTAWRWRRLEQLDDYVDATTESVVAWSKRVDEIHAEHPTGRWSRWRQRRRLLSIAKYFERAATRLERTNP